MGRTDALSVIFNAKGATGAGQAVDVSDYRHVVVSIATDGGGDANMTVKCQGSIQETEPTWTDAQSVANLYEFIHMYDLQNATGLAGDTGFIVVGADDIRIFLVNVDGLKWLNFRVTARAEGEVTVKVRSFNNN